MTALALVVACGRTAPTPAEIAERSWRAHEVVIRAGEDAPSCPAAGAAMQAAFATHRQAFVDGLALDQDKERLAEAITYLEQHGERYRTLETRMAALSDRCGADPSVAAAFRQMEAPSGTAQSKAP